MVRFLSRRAAAGPLRGFIGMAPDADRRINQDSRALIAADIMPYFA
jgi:hypothetical protein